MFVEQLELTDFRNYASLGARFSPGANIFYGNNGHGKTNILESVFYCAIGRSFRYSKDGDLVRSGTEGFRISAGIREDLTENITVRYSLSGEKVVRVNNIYLRKLGQLMGRLLCVIFSPEDMEIVNDGPSVRRKLMDIVISQIYPSHYFDLQQYNKIVAQKNTVLREYDRGSQGSSTLLDVYNQQLAETGVRIGRRRSEFIAELEKHASENNAAISGGEQLTVKYTTNFFDAGDEGAFYRLLTEKMPRELERQHSLYGPQYDDLELCLGGLDIKRFGSQGQKRTAVLSIKLAELMLLKQFTGRTPVLLLDDVFSELDEKRCELLLSAIRGFQTFITSATLSELPERIRSDAGIFFVKSGTIQLI